MQIGISWSQALYITVSSIQKGIVIYITNSCSSNTWKYCTEIIHPPSTAHPTWQKPNHPPITSSLAPEEIEAMEPMLRKCGLSCSLQWGGHDSTFTPLPGVSGTSLPRCQTRRQRRQVSYEQLGGEFFGKFFFVSTQSILLTLTPEMWQTLPGFPSTNTEQTMQRLVASMQLVMLKLSAMAMLHFLRLSWRQQVTWAGEEAQGPEKTAGKEVSAKAVTTLAMGEE